MLRGSSGFYTYAIYEHLPEWPPFEIGETRITFKLSKDKYIPLTLFFSSFFWMIIFAFQLLKLRYWFSLHFTGFSIWLLQMTSRGKCLYQKIGYQDDAKPSTLLKLFCLSIPWTINFKERWNFTKILTILMCNVFTLGIIWFHWKTCSCPGWWQIPVFIAQQRSVTPWLDEFQSVCWVLANQSQWWVPLWWTPQTKPNLSCRPHKPRGKSLLQNSLNVDSYNFSLVFWSDNCPINRCFLADTTQVKIWYQNLMQGSHGRKFLVLFLFISTLHVKGMRPDACGMMLKYRSGVRHFPLTN